MGKVVGFRISDYNIGRMILSFDRTVVAGEPRGWSHESGVPLSLCPLPSDPTTKEEEDK
jgi:hypothetical protein